MGFFVTCRRLGVYDFIAFKAIISNIKYDFGCTYLRGTAEVLREMIGCTDYFRAFRYLFIKLNNIQVLNVF